VFRLYRVTVVLVSLGAPFGAGWAGAAGRVRVMGVDAERRGRMVGLEVPCEPLRAGAVSVVGPQRRRGAGDDLDARVSAVDALVKGAQQPEVRLVPALERLHAADEVRRQELAEIGVVVQGCGADGVERLRSVGVARRWVVRITLTPAA